MKIPPHDHTRHVQPSLFLPCYVLSSEEAHELTALLRDNFAISPQYVMFKGTHMLVIPDEMVIIWEEEG